MELLLLIHLSEHSEVVEKRSRVESGSKRFTNEPINRVHAWAESCCFYTLWLCDVHSRQYDVEVCINSVTYCSQILDDVGGVLGLCNLCWTKDVLKGGWGAPFHCKQKQHYVHVCFWLRSKHSNERTKNRTFQRRGCARASSTLGSYASAKVKLILEAQIKSSFLNQGMSDIFWDSFYWTNTRNTPLFWQLTRGRMKAPHKRKAKNICVYDSIITLWPLIDLLPLKGAAFTAGVGFKSAGLEQNSFSDQIDVKPKIK